MFKEGSKSRRPKGPKGEEWKDNCGDESFNKGGHKERSFANQPNHSKHKNKITNRRKELETL